MTHATAPRKLARGAMVVLFWIAAALLVVQAHPLDDTSPAAGVTVKVVAIVAVAFAYMRLTARDASLDHALAVGAAWLLLDIVAELVTAAHVGRGWYELIGSPANAGLRDLLMTAWLGAPAIFARKRS